MRSWKRISIRLKWWIRRQINLIRQARETILASRKLPDRQNPKDPHRMILLICESWTLLRLVLSLLWENWKDSGQN